MYAQIATVRINIEQTSDNKALRQVALSTSPPISSLIARGHLRCNLLSLELMERDMRAKEAACVQLRTYLQQVQCLQLVLIFYDRALLHKRNVGGQRSCCCCRC